jgi:hypothetical protein
MGRGMESKITSRPTKPEIRQGNNETLITTSRIVLIAKPTISNLLKTISAFYGY